MPCAKLCVPWQIYEKNFTDTLLVVKRMKRFENVNLSLNAVFVYV